MNLKPLHDWTLIRQSKEVETTSGGIIIPDVAKTKPQEGEVLAIGEGRFKEKKDKKGKVTERNFVKTTLHAGDRVLYEKYSAVEVPGVLGEDLVLVREEDVLGLLE